MNNILNFKEFEKITLNIDIDDLLLGGKFKNKTIKVKKNGINAKDDIAINNKPFTKFRLKDKKE